MKKLLFAFMAITLFACSSDDSAPVDPNNGNPNPENPNPENPNPVEECTNVYNGNIYLESQAEVDAFAAHHYCTIQNGEIFIGPINNTGSDIADISGLESLKHINGRMYIVNNPDLVSLNGLHNIENIGSLSIKNNDKLVNLQGLNSLKQLGTEDGPGSLIVTENELLVNFEGLGPIKRINGIIILRNASLLNFKGLESLEELWSISQIHNNTSLISLEGLGNVKKVKFLDIRFNVNLSSIEHLNGLTEAYSLTFNDCKSLSNLHGLENITELTILDIADNSSLTSLQGLQNLHTISDLVIENNDLLENISYLHGLTTVKPSSEALYNRFNILGNALIASLDGLQNITAFEAELRIESNSLLKNFCAISNVINAASTTDIQYNGYNPTVQDITSGNCSQP